jgi:DNA-binding transcriptional ArsR family regulator
MSAASGTARKGAGRLVGVPALLRSSDGLARVFAALGDPTRLKLVALLCAGGALSIAQLTTNTAMTRQAVTKHLQVLAEAGVVRDTRLGRERLWQLDPRQLEEARRTLEAIGRQWDVALGNLKAFVESTP